MKIIESFLEKAWGDSIDNPSLQDIKNTISETQEMDFEHGAFWVGIFGENGEEEVLEVDKNLEITLILVSNNPIELKKTADSWSSIERTYEKFLSGNTEAIKDWIRNE